MSAAISLRNIKHGFKPLTSNAAICAECDGAFDDPLHSAPPALNYPINYGSLRLAGPTLIYIDQHGTPVQLELSDEQAQMIIDDWNCGANLKSEFGEVPTQLKPPRAR